MNNNLPRGKDAVKPASKFPQKNSSDAHRRAISATRSSLMLFLLYLASKLKSGGERARELKNY
jgi:hypothetical protein